jgi:gentisate 1,2-dioxygenase
MTMADAMMSDAHERVALAEELARFNCAVHQPSDPPLFTAVPKPSMRPLHWRAEDIARLLEKLGASIKLEAGGNRRTLRLANPGLPFGTTPTLWASIQYILPGEVATGHRHAATALRFVMKGSGADTIVDGEQYVMNEGDLVLTPGWTYHDHEHKGSEPMIWLDVLDISLVRSLDGVFFEGMTEPRQHVNRLSDRAYREFGSGLMRPANAKREGLASPVLLYTRARAEEALAQAAALEGDPFDDILLEYQNPMTGGPALPTIGTALQMLRPGAELQAHRQTGSTVYYVVRGEGATQVDDQRFDWGPGDFIAIPSWAAHRHANRSRAQEAVLFQVNDSPALKALGLYREQAA